MQITMTPSHANRVLVVDDTTANLQLLTSLLTDHGYIAHPASDGKLALEFVRLVLPDLILLDIRMPGMDGYEVCRRLKADERTRSIPIIFISILEEEHDKVKGFQEGAVDYITKPFQPEEVLARVRTHLHLRELTEHLEYKVAERTEELMIAKERLQQELAERMRAEEQLRKSEHHKTIQNQIANIFLTIPDQDMYREVLTIVIQTMESRFGIFGFIETNGDLVIPSLSREIWNECQVSDKSIVFPRDTWGPSLWGRALREQKALYSAAPFHTPKGHVHIDNFLAVPIIFGNETIGLLSVANSKRCYAEEDKKLLENIADYISPILNARLQRDRQEQGRKQAEEEREKLQKQILQARKMELVGQLAGGVAHDFNNMLGVIIGQVEMALNEADQAQPLFNHLLEIHKAAERSADLTRQLLGFARKQTISPTVLAMNETVESMLKMLRRLIGEEICLTWLPGAELWKVKLDPSQIDQVLANLCVNARDAIAGMGKITIQTENVIFDEAYCADHADTAPGEYVLLAVNDDGRGMDRETLDKVFEPFFTTKELGKGTGLGLATVYGIVRQNNGFINVYSELGRGTTFRIYLPRHAANTEQMRKESCKPPIIRGNETILLVEDEPAILDMVKEMLETFGYQVLASPTPNLAIRISKEYSDEIHLLITDVVMPEMTGWDLSKKLTSLYPGLKCLFMSGYMENVIAHHGVLDEGVNFIQKPFSRQALATKVREILNIK